MAVTFTQVRLTFDLANGKTIDPELNFKVDGADPSFSALGDMAQGAYDAVVSGNLMDQYTADVIFTGALAQNFTTVLPGGKYPNGRITPITLAASSSGDNIVGGDSGDNIPPQCSAVWSMSSETPGAKGRGRWYGPPPGEAEVGDTGGITGSWCDALDVALQAVVTGVIDSVEASVDHVVVSRKYQALHGVVATIVHPVVRTQRRRASRSL